MSVDYGFDTVASGFGGVSDPLLKRNWLHFANEWSLLAKNVNEVANVNGFWEVDNTSEKLALIHSEISEALEASRKDINAPDHHIPGYSNFAVELADAVIRIMDLATQRGIPLGQVIAAKHEYNKTRPYKHGKKF